MELIDDAYTAGKHRFRDISVSLPHVEGDIFHIFSFFKRDLVEVITEIAFPSGRQDINDFFIYIVKKNTDIITVTAFEGISLIKAKAFRKFSPVRLDMPVKERGSRGSRHMVTIRDITESDFRIFEIMKDIIYGRNGNSGISGNERIFFIECFAAERTDIASRSVMDDTGSRIENGVIDLSGLITFDFQGRSGANRTAMFSDTKLKKDGKGAILMRNMDIFDIGSVQAEGREEVG